MRAPARGKTDAGPSARNDPEVPLAAELRDILVQLLQDLSIGQKRNDGFLEVLKTLVLVLGGMLFKITYRFVPAYPDEKPDLLFHEPLDQEPFSKHSAELRLGHFLFCKEVRKGLVGSELLPELVELGADLLIGDLDEPEPARLLDEQ